MGDGKFLISIVHNDNFEDFEDIDSSKLIQENELDQIDQIELIKIVDKNGKKLQINDMIDYNNQIYFIHKIDVNENNFIIICDKFNDKSNDDYDFYTIIEERDFNKIELIAHDNLLEQPEATPPLKSEFKLSPNAFDFKPISQVITPITNSEHLPIIGRIKGCYNYKKYFSLSSNIMNELNNNITKYSIIF